MSRTYFETPNRRYNLTDCGGHQKYVPLMTNAVLQSNFAVVIVSAIKNEFNASFLQDAEKGYEGSVR